MGFFVMAFSALVGIGLVVGGFVLGRRNRRWIALGVPGVLLLAVAVWLGMPQ